MIYDYLRGAAEPKLDETTGRVVPQTQSSAVLAFLLLAGWIVAIGLILTAVIWVISGAYSQAAIPAGIGAVMIVVLRRLSRL